MVSHYPLLSQQDMKQGFVTNVVQCMTPIAPPKDLETAKGNENARVLNQHPLVPPQLLKANIHASFEAFQAVNKGRRDATRVISQASDKLLAVCGLCSLHDLAAAFDYADCLKELSDELDDDLVVIMRAYLEKPRTTVGWKGLINDPDLDGSFQINKGLAVSRKLSVISLARNGTDGSVTVAVDALRSAASKYHFLGVTEQGLASIVETTWNTHSFIILRGSTKGTNYDSSSVNAAKDALRKQDQREVVMIDCSHGNSRKDHNNQPLFANDAVDQLCAGEKGIVGVMIESNLCAGNQKVTNSGLAGLKKGVSITDACIDWDTTVGVIRNLARGARERRKWNAFA